MVKGELMAINWFPGHMKKASRQIKEKLSLVDIACEILDASIPRSSSNKFLEDIVKSKPILIILNKADLADPEITKKWLKYYADKGMRVVACDSQKENKLSKRVYDEAKILAKDLFEKRKYKGIRNKEIRMLVFGIPNSGKSTFINNLAGKRAAKVGNKPGITRDQRWIRCENSLLIMDTPGIMMKKLNNKEGFHLAWTGAIKEEVLDLQELGYAFIEHIMSVKAEAILDKYKLASGLSSLEIMVEIGKNIGAMNGNYVDYDRVSKRILDDFRKGRLGRISLESPEG